MSATVGYLTPSRAGYEVSDENMLSQSTYLCSRSYIWAHSLLVYIILYRVVVWIPGLYLIWLDTNIYSTVCHSIFAKEIHA